MIQTERTQEVFLDLVQSSQCRSFCAAGIVCANMVSSMNLKCACFSQTKCRRSLTFAMFFLASAHVSVYSARPMPYCSHMYICLKMSRGFRSPFNVKTG